MWELLCAPNHHCHCALSVDWSNNTGDVVPGTLSSLGQEDWGCPIAICTLVGFSLLPSFTKLFLCPRASVWFSAKGHQTNSWKN
jgi:hypothetical protein